MTAIQQLIEIIKQKRKEAEISNTLLRFVQIEAEKLLEMEKEQMRSASCPYIGGWEEGEFEDWYNETYKK
jgi:hypothetical protein